MTGNYRVNGLTSVVSFLTGGILTAMAVVAFTLGRYWLAALFLLLGIAFLTVGFLNASRIRLEDRGVTRTLLGRKLREIPRGCLREVGVVGLRVFGDKEKTGTKYIYFSDHEMDEKERFQMCLSWPPKDAIYMAWSPKRQNAVQMFWQGELASCNAGEDD